MKKLIFLFAILGILPLFAQQNIDNATVSVTGEGIVKVTPDEVLIKSRIEHEGPSPEQVKTQNDKVVNDIIKYLKSQGIDEKDIQTDYVNLNKRYEYNDKTRTTKYVANQAISITLHDIKDYEKIMKGLLENGLNRIDGIQFKSSEMAKYEKESRKMAVLDAQSKAKQLAEPLGQEIGKAISISEMEFNNVQPMYRMDKAVMNESVESEETIAPGELEVKIRVNVSFHLK